MPGPIDAGQAARQHGALAIAVLAAITEDADAPATARVAAAGKLLERGYGRVGAELSAEPDFAGMTDAELDAALLQHLQQPAG